MVTQAEQSVPGGKAAWEDFNINILDHDDANNALPGNARFGNDYIAGGAHADQIFGQLGDDVIQGDGSIDLIVGAGRNGDGNLVVAASVEDYAACRFRR